MLGGLKVCSLVQQSLQPAWCCSPCNLLGAAGLSRSIAAAPRSPTDFEHLIEIKGGELEVHPLTRWFRCALLLLILIQLADIATDNAAA